MDADPTILGYRRGLLIAGAVGVMVGIIHRRDFTWPTAIVGAVMGASSVLFVAPGAIEILGQFTKVGDGVEGLVYWLCGSAGVYVVTALMSIMRNPWAAFQRWRQIRGGQP